MNRVTGTLARAPALALALAFTLALASLAACTPTATSDTSPHPDTRADATAWDAYYARSERTRQLDQDFIAAELRSLGKDKPERPAYARTFGFDPEQPDDWFLSREGRRTMDIIVSFQTPSGGWSKRTDMALEARRPGVAFGTEHKYIPTFDNAATTTQLQLLARAYRLTGKTHYRDAFDRGLALIIAAQYPNGGWPQIYPLAGDYHDYITYNDELMEDILSVLLSVSQAQGHFAFVTAEQRAAATQGLALGLQCVLATQVITDGKRSIWGAQHHPRTLEPAKARAYEMAALASAESVTLLQLLMQLPDPSPALVAAIHDAVDWYEDTRITGHRWNMGDSELKADPSAPPLWARFYELGTNRPVFGDRDGSVHYDISAISQERRAGYAWYTTRPNQVLKEYRRWAVQFPRDE